MSRPSDGSRSASAQAASARPVSRRVWLWRGALVIVGGLVLYGFLPEMVDLWSQVPRLQSVGVIAAVFMALLQFASWWCSAELDRVVLPGMSRFVAVTASLAANAVSRVVPGAGGALGVGVSYRMWTDSGEEVGAAASAMAATTVMSLATLFALPIVTLFFAAVGASTPRSLALVALVGAVSSAALFVLGALLLFNDAFLRSCARFVEVIALRMHRSVVASEVETERDRLRGVLGARWPAALGVSIGIWAFDYLSLVAVLVALHVSPQPGVVLLAFTSAKIVAMVPVTPGGLGLVEAGLTGVLLLAGIPSAQALLATLAYRVVSYWLSLPAGLVAWLMFRRRYPRASEARR
jgi:uncharacterized protein (TIRG00374 family)